MPAVYAGPPQKDDNFFMHDLKGTTLYIHNDLFERNIEVFMAGSALPKSLAAREY
jgi:hypothetical protein